MSHRIGLHSDDKPYPGEELCYCDESTKSQTDNTELGEILKAYKRYPYGTKELPHLDGDQTITAIEQKYIRRKDLAGLLPEKKPVESTWVVLPTGQTVQDKDTANWYNGYNQAIDDFRQTLNLVEENMSKQDGYIEVIVPVIIVLLASWWLIGQWHKSEAHKQAFNNWTTDCYDLGGEIKTSGANTVDCFVSDEPCRIVGYEKWEVVNPNSYFRNLPECAKSKPQKGL